MSVTSKPSLQPLDRAAIALMLGLSLLIGLLLWQGSAVRPKVADFSWQDQQVGAADTSFTMTFSRPMDTKSVEENLQINPPLPGKFSWAGRRMVYTLLSPAPYDTTYTVKLSKAQDRFTEEGAKSRQLQPFAGHFTSRDRAFIYLGVTGEEQGRLILYNLTHQQKQLLTPQNLVVVDFKPYPDGKKVLFSATEHQPGLLSSQLYTVTTGIGTSDRATPSEPSGKIDLILDNKDYQNLKFDLSPDGKTIVVQRVNRRNPSDLDLWVLRPNQPPQPLAAQPGGDFTITPDSAAVAVAQGQGVAILPLSPAPKPFDFLPQFGLVLDFAQDGSAAAMVKFNSDYTRSLFLVTNQGVQKQLLRTTGSILSAQFNPTKQTLYCLLTQLLAQKTYQEQPYLAAIDIKTGKQTLLSTLPQQRDVQWSLSPDGLALLFDQIVTAPTPNQSNNSATAAQGGEAIATSHLWLLPLLPVTSSGSQPQLQPEPLPLPGFHPRWLP